MNSDQPNPKAPYQPSLHIRLLAWFGIYFAAQLPLIPYHADLVWFPMGIFGPFVLLADKITRTEIALPIWTLKAAYALYTVHLAASLIVRRRKMFRILIWIGYLPKWSEARRYITYAVQVQIGPRDE